MRFVLALSLLAVACGGSDVDSTAGSEDDLSSTSSQERWCNSYKTEEYCPTNVCVWHEAKGAEQKPAYCGLPSPI